MSPQTQPWAPVNLAHACLDANIGAWPAVTAVAICLAESGGNAYALHINDADPTSGGYLSIDIGAWQTNTRWHPEIPIHDALDPRVQAVHVKRIANPGRGWVYAWTAWATFRTGAHLKFMSAARVAVREAGGLV